MVESPTFGCGTWLGGFGPGNFPEFGGGGTIDGGDGTGGTFGETDPGEPTTRPQPGPDPTPGNGGGGGGGGGGPGTPGPAGPAAPAPGPATGGGGGRCRCRISGPPAVNAAPFTPQSGQTGYTRYTVTWKQKCTLERGGPPAPGSTSEEIVNDYMTSATADTGYTYTKPKQRGAGDTNCKENNRCGGKCDDISITYDRFRVVNEGGGLSQADSGSTYPLGGQTTIGTDSGLGSTDTGTGGTSIGGAKSSGTGGGLTDAGEGLSEGVGPGYGGTVRIDGLDTTGLGGGVTDAVGGGLRTTTNPGTSEDPRYGGIYGGEPTGGTTVAGGSTLVDFPVAGAGIERTWDWTAQSIFDAAKNSNEIDLDRSLLGQRIGEARPAGVEEYSVAFVTTPSPASMVENLTGNDQLFSNTINSNVAYVLGNRKRSGDWDSTRVGGVTPLTLYESLKPQIKTLLSKIQNYDGSPLTTNQIFSMIGSRIIDGTVNSITLGFLQRLADSSKKRNSIVIKPSRNSKVNEVAALALVERNMFTLDPAKAEGRMKNILPNWKTLATDVDKYIPIMVGGVEQKYYLKDDDTFIDRSSLSIHDGDYFEVYRGATPTRLFTKSEKDHAYIIPEVTRQRAIKLLGGDTARTLQVSAPLASSIEFDYSLSDSREGFYFLSCVLSSINTEPSPTGSFLLKESTIKYNLVNTRTEEGLSAVNEYIRYKANHKVFVIDDSDLLLDYMTATNEMTIKQTDILFNSPKENKTIPLLTRQIPWYILVYPTNRSDLNIFNSKSNISFMSLSGTVTRELKTRPSIVPEFSKSRTNKFITTETSSIEALNVFGETDPQTRITQINKTDKVFKTGYLKSGKLLAAENFTPSRKKTGFRLVKEIITELDNNYLLSLNGVGKSLTEFDVYSRLSLQQFNGLFGTENFNLIRNTVRGGIIADVKMIPPIRNADSRLAIQNTQLVQRKKDAPADTFRSIKSTQKNQVIIPPTTTEQASTGAVPTSAERT